MLFFLKSTIRQAEWRARNLEFSRAKDRENGKKYQAKLKLILTPEQKLERRKKHTQHVRNYRARKKAERFGLDLHALPHQVIIVLSKYFFYIDY